MIFADLHAHSFLRPFESRGNGVTAMSDDPNDISSIWNEYNLPKDSLRHLIGEHAGFTTYSQSDFTSTVNSSVRLIGISLYPPESGFFKIPNSTTFDKILGLFKRIKDLAEVELGHIVSSFTKSNIRRLKSDEYDYFEELLDQLQYIKNGPFTPDPAKCLGTVYSQIKNAEYTILQPGENIELINSDPIIQIFLNIEGGNSLWSNVTLAGEHWNGRNFDEHTTDNILHTYQALNVNDFRNQVTIDMAENNPGVMNRLWSNEACDMVMNNLRQLLSNNNIFSFTLAHHYYNGLCGHCDSLQPITSLGLTDQHFGKDSDITHLGYMVINELLKNNVLVDVKHMSWKARQSYYRFRANNYPHIPIVWSHGCVSGRKAIGDTDFISTCNPNPFYQQNINMFDDDIFETIRSNGMIGVEFDQRVNGVKDSSIETLWKHFQYIAEKAALVRRIPGITVWDNICLGTDFDGVIHPVDEFQTYRVMNRFEDFLLTQIKKYMVHPPATFQHQDILDADEILARLCFKNLVWFVKQNFK
jgi:hypothetical protein